MTLTPTQTNMLASVAERTGATFDRLAACWPDTDPARPDHERAQQLAAWASPDPGLWRESSSHPDFRLAASVWRRRSCSGDSPPRTVRFTGTPLAPRQFTRADGSFVSNTYDPAGMYISEGGAAVVVEHDTDQPMGQVESLVVDGHDVHTVITLDRSALADEVITSVVTGGDIDISWALGLHYERATWTGDSAHHHRARLDHVGITRTPLNPSTRRPMLLTRSALDRMRPPRNIAGPQLAQAHAPGTVLQDERVVIARAMAEAMQRGAQFRTVGGKGGRELFSAPVFHRSVVVR